MPLIRVSKSPPTNTGLVIQVQLYDLHNCRLLGLSRIPGHLDSPIAWTMFAVHMVPVQFLGEVTLFSALPDKVCSYRGLQTSTTCDLAPAPEAYL